jgi:hypothetical protein
MSLLTEILTISIDNDIFSTLLINKDKFNKKKTCFSISEWRLETLQQLETQLDLGFFSNVGQVFEGLLNINQVLPHVYI